MSTPNLFTSSPYRPFQDKIINGYAALLRTHNPRLASKVFLDERGRLKVLRVDGKDARHRREGDGERRARGSSRRHRYGAADDTWKGQRVSPPMGSSGRREVFRGRASCSVIAA